MLSACGLSTESILVIGVLQQLDDLPMPGIVVSHWTPRSRALAWNKCNVVVTWAICIPWTTTAVVCGIAALTRQPPNHPQPPSLFCMLLSCLTTVFDHFDRVRLGSKTGIAIEPFPLFRPFGVVADFLGIQVRPLVLEFQSRSTSHDHAMSFCVMTVGRKRFSVCSVHPYGILGHDTASASTMATAKLRRVADFEHVTDRPGVRLGTLTVTLADFLRRGERCPPTIRSSACHAHDTAV